MRSLPGAEVFSAELEARLADAAASDAESVRSRHRESDGSARYTNRLVLEASPYLRQHAHNPVSWHPWGDEPFAEARRRGCPVFLSIGYSTCHWCHVMEEESFEDEEIAAFLNRHYVAIKVDREERPDVDAIYMRAAQTLTGAGGWPLSVWLTPQREPFYAGTYFPPRAGVRGAGAGFIDLLASIAHLYHEDPEHVRLAAQSLTEAVRDSERLVAPAPARDGGSMLAWIGGAVATCRDRFDDRYGGLRSQQKFPSHVPVRLLLRHHHRTADRDALTMAVRTLEAMAAGGIYDHVAGGFHRYSTDPAWRVPHFEKMLYDNAQLVVAYSEAWQVTRHPTFARVVAETCDELLATFASPEGGFYSATDADSEGEEGKYFTWSEREIRAVLGDGEESQSFLAHYGIPTGGDEAREHVLAQVALDEDVVSSLASARARLATARRLRTPPLRDEKILAAWNGLAISAFAVAGRVFARPRYVEAARRAASFVLTRLRDAGSARLVRSYRDGRPGARGFLDDHAFVAAGLLDLFEATYEARWWQEALGLCEVVESDFADGQAGGWFVTSPAHERLLTRERSLFDGAEPAGGSVALMNAARLAEYTEDRRWAEVVERALAFYRPFMESAPLAMSEALLAADFVAGPVREVVVAAADGVSAEAFAEVLRGRFLPRKVVVIGQPGSADWRALEGSLPLLRAKTAEPGGAVAYVCSHGRCDLPATDPARFAEQLSG